MEVAVGVRISKTGFIFREWRWLPLVIILLKKFLLNTVCQSLSYETRADIYWVPTMYQALYILTSLNPHDNSLRQILVWVMWNFHFHGSKRSNIGKFLESDLNVNLFYFIGGSEKISKLKFIQQIHGSVRTSTQTLTTPPHLTLS